MVTNDSSQKIGVSASSITSATVLNASGTNPSDQTTPQVAATKPKQRLKGGVVESLYSTRSVKHYNLNDSDLGQLSVLDRVASICFTIGSAFLGYSVDGIISIIQSESISLTFKDGISIPFFVFSLILLVVGTVSFYKRGARLEEIKRECRFE